MKKITFREDLDPKVSLAMAAVGWLIFLYFLNGAMRGGLYIPARSLQGWGLHYHTGMSSWIYTAAVAVAYVFIRAGGEGFFLTKKARIMTLVELTLLLFSILGMRYWVAK